MVSVKALAAIALTLIICLPIGLGYAFATDNEDVTGWESTDETNLSEQLLNSDLPYYASYNGPNNNTWIADSTLATYPDYVNVGTTVTSIPTYNYNVSTLPVNQDGSERYISGVWNGTAVSGSYIGSDAAFEYTSASVVIHPVTRFTIPTDMLLVVEQYPTGIAIAGQTTISTIRISGPSNLTVTQYNDDPFGNPWYQVAYFEEDVAGGQTLECVNWYICTLDGTRTTVPFTWASASVDLSVSRLYSVAPTSSLTLDDGTILAWPGSWTWNLFEVIGGAVWVDGVKYTTSTLTLNTGYLPANYRGGDATGYYADPDAGWTLPESNETFGWFNLYENSLANLYLKMPNGSAVTLEVSGVSVELVKSGNVVSMIHNGSTTKIGAYTYLKVTIQSGGIYISGLSAWSTMGGTANLLRTVTIEEDIAAFNKISMTDTGTNKVTFRVDSTAILSGTFRGTYDLGFNMAQYYPDESYTVILNSIAIYGDYFGFAGQSYAVKDGKITVDGKEMSIKGLELSSWLQEDGTYENRIKTTVINTTDAPATLYFGGEWSLTAQRFTMEETTDTVLKWQPGEFAFTKEDFVACGLLVCGAAFLALGLTGRANGGKALLLALICGGAGLGYLTLL